MAIGKTVMLFFGFLIGIVCMYGMYSLAFVSKSKESFYSNASYAVNQSINMAEPVLSSTPNMLSPGILILGILLFGSIIMIFLKVRK